MCRRRFGRVYAAKRDQESIGQTQNQTAYIDRDLVVRRNLYGTGNDAEGTGQPQSDLAAEEMGECARNQCRYEGAER